MERDALVRVAATGGYGTVYSVEEGVCEVALIDPQAEEDFLSVPQAMVEPLERAYPESMGELAGRLALLHLRVSCGAAAGGGFEAFVGRTEDDALELWWAEGNHRARRVSHLEGGQASALASALRGLDLEPWEHGGGAPARPGGWHWSLECAGASMGASGFGHDGAPEGLRDVVEALAGMGLPLIWDDEGPHLA
ncbi:hypothetical protein [Olsenella sp. DNF00959]|uniref:hypothetical protein n=1 Tax=Olsenella sp. DNF00959 TaxID=1476999 RepID=UPI000783F024|nr:hypothetical protein [Olsenella sp. DNF00959]KXB63958.1 hypothetical protein HMPREF1868_00472 [Olsenella sp. DNF00959]